MKVLSHKSKNVRWDRNLTVLICIAVNVLLYYLTNKYNLPLYLDTVGTMSVVAITGFFPGVLTAVVTNVLCSFIDGNALYFGIVNVIIALYTAAFWMKRGLSKAGNIIIYVLTVSVISGGISAILQLVLFEMPQKEAVSTAVVTLSELSGINGFAVFLIVNILLNILDKGVSLCAVILLMMFLPKDRIEAIRAAGLKQRPFSSAEMDDMRQRSKNIKYNNGRRVSMIMLVLSLSLAIVMGCIGVELYFKVMKEDRVRAAENTARAAAAIIDPDKVDAYLSNGESEDGYRETKELLERIRESSTVVQYLYVVKVRDEGGVIVFDLDTEDDAGYYPGYYMKFEKAFEPYFSAMSAGENIEPIESDFLSGWVITATAPVRNDRGICMCYVCADVSLKYVAGALWLFLLKVVLMLSGFFVLIVVYGLWNTAIYSVFPIDGIVMYVERFIRSGDDQESLDETVRMLRKLDVYTNDEVEMLYHSICNMALNQVEQLRRVRRLSDSALKMQDGLIITMANLVENRDSDTGAHVQKTAAYVKIIVEGLKRKGYYAEKITPKFISDVVRSAPLHDVGKINIPDGVLNKPGKLTDEEYEIIKTHTISGRDIMEQAIDTVEGENYLKEARNMAAYHHERWDGKGYPEGLHGEVIPLSARIMAVADVFDALTSERVYKPAFPMEKALQMIQEEAGHQFDPKCVEVFMESVQEVRVILKKYNTSKTSFGGSL